MWVTEVKYGTAVEVEQAGSKGIAEHGPDEEMNGI